MKCYLVDDEPPALGMLQLHLSKLAEVEVVGTSEDPLEAIPAINALAPDLLFLDIQMPELNGFEMLPYLKHNPLVIFCTAYDAYAIEAFKVNALDYLLKPVDPKRLCEALTRAKTELKKLDSLIKNNGTFNFEKVVCFKNGIHHLVWLQDMIHLVKVERYLQIKTLAGETFMSEISLKSLLDKLPQDRFFSVNRGEAIHIKAISCFEPSTSGTYLLRTFDNQEIRVSRRRTQAFKNWITKQQASVSS